MEMAKLSFRVPKKLDDEIEYLVTSGIFKNKSEAYRTILKQFTKKEKQDKITVAIENPFKSKPSQSDLARILWEEGYIPGFSEKEEAELDLSEKNQEYFQTMHDAQVTPEVMNKFVVNATRSYVEPRQEFLIKYFSGGWDKVKKESLRKRTTPRN